MSVFPGGMETVESRVLLLWFFLGKTLYWSDFYLGNIKLHFFNDGKIPAILLDFKHQKSVRSFALWTVGISE